MRCLKTPWRIGSLDAALNYHAPMDFFRFASNGQRDDTGGTDHALTYFGQDASHVFTGCIYHNLPTNGS